MDDKGAIAADALVGGIDRPGRTLPDLLDALMRALASRAGIARGLLRVDGQGTLVLGSVGKEFTTDWLSQSGKSAAERHSDGAAGARRPPSATDARRLVLPLRYGGAAIGALEVELSTAAAADRAEAGFFAAFARQCALLVKRYELRGWCARRFGQPLLLVGMSRAIRAVDAFLEIAAPVRLPVLITGEFGTEKAQLAALIHCCSAAADGPFVQIDCAEPSGAPADWIARAEGGSLYLSGLDELDPRLQKQLPQHLPSRLHQWLPAGAAKVRVIASSTADLDARAAAGQFSRALLAEIDFLTVAIPPLRDRSGDIPSLVAEALERNGYRHEEKSSGELVRLCRGYSWRDNLFELEQVVARLAAASGRRPIAMDDIRRHAPCLLEPVAAEGDAAAGSADDWARCALAGDAVRMRGLHPALRRALLHLAEHYRGPVCLADLSRRAGVSPSHLGFLFRSEISVPFKTLLAHIRIGRARALLAEQGRRSITDVALSVGYGDLSHFERSFRRIVGRCPRQYRAAVP